MRHLIIPLIAVGLIIYALTVSGCASDNQKPEPTIVTQTVTHDVTTPCPDKRSDAPNVPQSRGEMDASLAMAPDTYARVQLLLSWAVLWIARSSEDDKQIAVCSKP